MQTNHLNDLTRQLIAILSNQLTIGQALLTCLEAERSALIESKAQLLSAVSDEKKQQAAQFKAAERERLQISAQIAGILHVLPETLKIEDVMKAIDASSARILGQKKTALQKLMVRLQKQNQDNHTLLTHCHGLVTAALTMLKNLLFTKPTYVRSGQIQGGAQGGMLISSKI